MSCGRSSTLSRNFAKVKLSYRCCFEELTLWLVTDSLISFPFRDPRTGLMETFPLSFRYERPTLADLVGNVSKAIDWFFGLPALVDHQVCLAGQSKVDLGIHRPTRGLSLRLSTRTAQRCRDLLSRFTASRPIRRSCDLACPVSP